MIVIELIARRSASVKTQLLYKYRSEIGFENHPKMSHFNFFPVNIIGKIFAKSRSKWQKTKNSWKQRRSYFLSIWQKFKILILLWFSFLGQMRRFVIFSSTVKSSVENKSETASRKLTVQGQGWHFVHFRRLGVNRWYWHVPSPPGYESPFGCLREQRLSAKSPIASS